MIEYKKPIEILKSILDKEYESDDGDQYKIELFKGMTDSEINMFKKVLPNNYMPIEIEELLKFSSGFNFWGIEDISFNSYGHFGFEEVFPNSVQLAGDGFGNFWVLDILNNGDWGEVYFVCHDPPAIVKHSTSLSEFISHIDEFGTISKLSNLDIIHEKTVFEIYDGKLNYETTGIGKYSFPNDFLERLPDKFVIIDLIDKPIKTGFNWTKSGRNTKIIRFEDKLIWILEIKQKISFFSRLLNWIK